MRKNQQSIKENCCSTIQYPTPQNHDANRGGRGVRGLGRGQGGGRHSQNQ